MSKFTKTVLSSISVALAVSLTAPSAFAEKVSVSKLQEAVSDHALREKIIELCASDPNCDVVPIRPTKGDDFLQASRLTRAFYAQKIGLTAFNESENEFVISELGAMALDLSDLTSLAEGGQVCIGYYDDNGRCVGINVQWDYAQAQPHDGVLNNTPDSPNSVVFEMSKRVPSSYSLGKSSR